MKCAPYRTAAVVVSKLYVFLYLAVSCVIRIGICVRRSLFRVYTIVHATSLSHLYVSTHVQYPHRLLDHTDMKQ